MPLIRVSVSKAARSSIPDKAFRLSRSSRIASATLMQYAAFCRVIPSDLRCDEPPSKKRSGVNGTRLSTIRRYIALAEARETCCSRIMRINVEKQGLLAQRGGTPSASSRRARSLSRAAKYTEPSVSLFFVNDAVTKTEPVKLSWRPSDRQRGAADLSFRPQSGVARITQST